MAEFITRQAERDDFALAVDWAAQEGWNPGLDDLNAFFASDPGGFLMGFEDGAPVSSISVVRYGSGFGFLGFYIVRPDRRGRGYGLATWRAGMERLAGRTVGLDGVVAQQANYRQSGFALAGRNVRHAGVPVALAKNRTSDLTVRPVTEGDLAGLVAFDRTHFPDDRDAFVRAWVLPGDRAARRHSLGAFDDSGALRGYGTLRACREGHKIGPLFARDPATAEALFAGLCATAPEGETVVLDTPEGNPESVALAVRAGLAPVFETARMYRGPDPGLPLGRIYGITSFELG